MVTNCRSELLPYLSVYGSVPLLPSEMNKNTNRICGTHRIFGYNNNGIYRKFVHPKYAAFHIFPLINLYLSDFTVSHAGSCGAAFCLSFVSNILPTFVCNNSLGVLLCVFSTDYLSSLNSCHLPQTIPTLTECGLER